METKTNTIEEAIDELSSINVDFGQQDTSLYSDALIVYPNMNYCYYSGDIRGDIHSENYTPLTTALFWAPPDMAEDYFD